MSLRSSEGCGSWNAGAAVPCVGTTGSVRLEPLLPSSSDVVIEYGVGSTIDHKAFEIAIRMRWPAGKTHDVRCIVILRGYILPGSRSRGSAMDSRCAPLI